MFAIEHDRLLTPVAHGRSSHCSKPTQPNRIALLAFLRRHLSTLSVPNLKHNDEGK